MCYNERERQQVAKSGICFSYIINQIIYLKGKIRRMKEIILQRLKKLRLEMEKEKVNFYLIPTSDYHNSEYVGEYFKVREYFSGFTGSNGTLLVTENEAFLWTDGRYYIQAASELEGSTIVLMKMGEAGVPTAAEYLREHMKQGDVLGFDGRVVTKKYMDSVIKTVSENGIDLNQTMKYQRDIAGSIWKERKEKCCEPVVILEEKYHGQDMKEKMMMIREEMANVGAKYFFLSKLDDIMWLYNIRGNDVECNPVALAYTFITENECFLFIQKNAITKQFTSYAEDNHIQILEYEDTGSFLQDFAYQGTVLLDEAETSFLFYKTIAEHTTIITEKNKTEWLKSIKNETEIENMRKYFLLDSVAMCKFLYQLKMTDTITDELEAARCIDTLRSEIEDFCGLSFPTISAYGKNAAMMHYEADKEHYAKIEKKGFLLVDSGGQYKGATTDVTRTIAMGSLSEEEKKSFTLVLKGMLSLMDAVFLYGCTGRNLDILAREPIWRDRKDYKCGTGHGVGCYLNVHEGPQAISTKYIRNLEETVLEEGMTITDEPGIYIEGKYGIRTENTLLIRKEEENSDGQFMRFECLTYVPIDVDAIEQKYLDEESRTCLNHYHSMVQEKIAPYLTKEESKWLESITKPL